MAYDTHFTLHALASQVYAAIAKDGGAAICNAGVIDFGELIVVFDTFLTLHAARDLRSFIENEFGHPPQIIINSHYHNDHIWGNQVFLPEAQIISSNETRRLILTEGMEEYRWYSANSAQRLKDLHAQYEALVDAHERAELTIWIGEYRGAVETLPALRVTPPVITFDSRLEIHGSERKAELITYEGGHTGSDAILYLPQEGIVFASDLLFVGFHPYLAEGDPYKVKKALHELSQLDASIFVPGHGPVGSRDDLIRMIDYIEHCFESAQALVNEGSNYEERVKELSLPAQYSTWQISMFYRQNILSMCRKLGAQTG